MSSSEPSEPIDNADTGKVTTHPKKERKPTTRAKTCYNCGQTGHIARVCVNVRLEGEERKTINIARAQYRRCFNCGKMGHISVDCKNKPKGNKGCYNCGQEGHIAKECPNPREELK